MAVLIDSTVFITMERRGLRVADLGPLLPPGEIGLSAVTASELLVGVHRAASPAQRSRRQVFVETVIGTFPVLPFNLETARVHARLLVDLASRGLSIGHHDLFIAATALTHGWAMVTDNRREFDRVPGLVVVQPDW
ncbi:MAG: PIN domain-containing protein [Thermomicrobiales bacterium]